MHHAEPRDAENLTLTPSTHSWQVRPCQLAVQPAKGLSKPLDIPSGNQTGQFDYDEIQFEISICRGFPISMFDDTGG